MAFVVQYMDRKWVGQRREGEHMQQMAGDQESNSGLQLRDMVIAD